MLARYVRLLQLAELAAFGLLAAALGAGGWASLAILAAGPLLARLAIVAASFLLAWRWRTPRAPEHRIGILASARLVLGEWRALVAYSILYLPWERAFMRPDPPLARLDRPAIVLAHGYLANRGCFVPLARRLEAAGVGPVYAPNLRSWFAPIGRLSEDLSRCIADLAGATGQPVILVAHSMGGLGSRLHLARHGASQVAKLVTIASPHRGTALAAFGMGGNARQMRRGSAFLRDLEAAEGAGSVQVPTTCIYTTHDNLVAPQATATLPWARNVAIAGYGHIDILGAPELAAIIAEELRGPPGAAPRAA